MPKRKNEKEGKNLISLTSYSLYHTLNQNLPEAPLSQIRLKRLFTNIENASIKVKETIVLLIAEHARITENYRIDLEDPQLPYGMKQTRKKVTFDLQTLPSDLQWILHRNLEHLKKLEKQAKS